MDLERTLAAVPAAQWQTRQAVVLDWHDGPREGLCALSRPAAEFFFELVDERHNPDGLDDRLFRVHEIPAGTLAKTVTLLGELGSPTQPVWAPVWRFATPLSQQKAEQFLQEIQNKARPLSLIIATRDMERFQGCWNAGKTDGEVVDWFAKLGVELPLGA